MLDVSFREGRSGFFGAPPHLVTWKRKKKNGKIGRRKISLQSRKATLEFHIAQMVDVSTTKARLTTDDLEVFSCCDPMKKTGWFCRDPWDPYDGIL